MSDQKTTAVPTWMECEHKYGEMACAFWAGDMARYRELGKEYDAMLAAHEATYSPHLDQ